jgi:hypothetical protein
MEHDGFSAKDICDIIRTCKKSSVKELKLGSICVSFNLDSEITSNLGQAVVHAPEAHLNSDQRAYSADHSPHSMQTPEQKEFLALAEEQHTLIEDPMAHEQSAIDMYSKLPLRNHEQEDLDA